jgi:hypothetical protein
MNRQPYNRTSTDNLEQMKTQQYARESRYVSLRLWFREFVILPIWRCRDTGPNERHNTWVSINFNKPEAD